MTEQSTKKYKPPVMKRVGGVFLMAVGVVFLFFTLFYAAKDIPLWVFGKQTKAEVVELWLEQTGDVQERNEGERKFLFYLRYQFTTPRGKLITKTAKASVNEWSGMWEGQKIDIVYFPLYPNLNRLDDSQWSLLLSCTYLPLVVISFLSLRLGWYMLKSP